MYDTIIVFYQIVFLSINIKCVGRHTRDLRQKTISDRREFDLPKQFARSWMVICSAK